MQDKSHGMQPPRCEDGWNSLRNFIGNHQLPRKTIFMIASVSLKCQPFWKPGHGIHKGSVIAFRCSCKHPGCVKVSGAAALRATLKRGFDPAQCPAHDTQCSTYSSHVAEFYHTLVSLGYNYTIVWDWHDVPQYSHMHFDATILIPSALTPGSAIAKRFEIDSRYHFPSGGCTRLRTDKAKDLL